MALELVNRTGNGILEAWFQIGADDFFGVGVQRQLEILAAGIWMWVAEEPVVQADLYGQRVFCADPVQVALDLVVGAAFGTAFAVREIGAMDRDDVAVFVLVAASAFDHIAVAQAYLVAREQTEVTLGRYFHEIFFFNPQLLADREVTMFAVVQRMRRGIHRCTALHAFIFGEVVDDQLEWAQYSHGARRLGVEIVAQGTFQNAVVDPAIVLGGTGTFTHQTDCFRRIAAPAQANDGWHAWIVPAGHDVFVHQLLELALAGDDVG